MLSFFFPVECSWKIFTFIRLFLDLNENFSLKLKLKNMWSEITLHFQILFSSTK